MIDVKEAVKQASQYVRDVFPAVEDLQLEEVEIANGDGNWNVTLSYLRVVQLDSFSPFSAAKIVGEVLGSGKYERVYKVVAVDANSGECQSIKIRQLQ